jgi:hypothetical protein
MFGLCAAPELGQMVKDTIRLWMKNLGLASKALQHTGDLMAVPQAAEQ